MAVGKDDLCQQIRSRVQYGSLNSCIFNCRQLKAHDDSVNLVVVHRPTLNSVVVMISEFFGCYLRDWGQETVEEQISSQMHFN